MTTFVVAALGFSVFAPLDSITDAHKAICDSLDHTKTCRYFDVLHLYLIERGTRLFVRFGRLYPHYPFREVCTQFQGQNDWPRYAREGRGTSQCFITVTQSHDRPRRRAVLRFLVTCHDFRLPAKKKERARPALLTGRPFRLQSNENERARPAKPFHKTLWKEKGKTSQTSFTRRYAKKRAIFTHEKKGQNQPKFFIRRYGEKGARPIQPLPTKRTGKTSQIVFMRRYGKKRARPT